MFYAENSDSNLDEAIEISDTEEEIVTPKIGDSSKNLPNISSLLRFSNRKDFTVSVIKDENNDDEFDKYFLKLLVKIDNGWKCRECKDKYSFRKVAEKHIRSVHMKDKTYLQNQVTQLLNRVPVPQQKSNFSHFPQNQLKSILKKPINSAQYSKVASSSGEFTCDVCGIECNNKTRFRNHTMTYKHYFTCTYCESTYRKRNELTKHKEVCQNKKLPTIKPKILARTTLPAKNVGPIYKRPNPHRPSTNFPHYPSGPPRPPLGRYNATNSIRPKSSFIKNSYKCQFCGFENNPILQNKSTFTCISCGRECSKAKSKALNQWENAHAPVGYNRAAQGFSHGYQNFKKSKAVENNTPAGLLATLFPQGYQGANNTAPSNFQQNEGTDQVEEDEEVSNPQEEVKVQPKTWEAADDKGFPPGWKWKLSNPWSRRLKFMAPDGKVFKSRMAAAKYMEAQGGYTREQIEKVKNSDDLGEKDQKTVEVFGDKNEFINENEMEEEMEGDISLEQRIEEIRKSITTDFDSSLTKEKRTIDVMKDY